MPKVDEVLFNQALDELTALIKPPSIAMGMSRIDTDQRHGTIGGSDHLAFLKLRTNFFLRQGWTREFDETPAVCFGDQVKDLPQSLQTVLPRKLFREIWKLVPPLWVSVARIAEDVHQVTALYRGNPDWPTEIMDGGRIVTLTGNALVPILKTIQACGGCDRPAFEAFLKKHWNTALNYLAVTDSEGTVN